MGRLVNALRALTAPSMEASAHYGPSSSVGANDGWFVRMLGGGPTNAGTHVSETNALYLPVVYACVNRIANPVANFPVGIVEPDGRGGWTRVEQHPMSQRLGLRPNDFMSSRTLRKTTQAHALLWGNGYQEIERLLLGGSRVCRGEHVQRLSRLAVPSESVQQWCYAGAANERHHHVDPLGRGDLARELAADARLARRVGE